MLIIRRIIVMLLIFVVVLGLLGKINLWLLGLFLLAGGIALALPQIRARTLRQG